MKRDIYSLSRKINQTQSLLVVINFASLVSSFFYSTILFFWGSFYLMPLLIILNAYILIKYRQGVVWRGRGGRIIEYKGKLAVKEGWRQVRIGIFLILLITALMFLVCLA